MGSLRTLQKGKRAHACQQELEGILRHDKNALTKVFAVHGFEVRSDWIRVNEYQDLILDDIEVGLGAVRVRREPAGSFAVRHFLGEEEHDPLIWDRFFAELDSFMENIEIWTHDMVIPCPECNGARKRILNGTTYGCGTCNGAGEIYRDALP